MELDDEQPKKELLQIYDAEGYPTKGLARAEVKAEDPRTSWYAVVNVWLIGPDGRILCSQRSEKNQNNPGKWQTYFGGHVKVGHTFVEALEKGLREEIGLAIDRSKLYLVERGSDPKNLAHFGFYILPFGGRAEDLKFSDGEISAVRWLTIDECRQEREAAADKWCNAISSRFEPGIRSWIAGGGRGRTEKK